MKLKKIILTLIIISTAPFFWLSTQTHVLANDATYAFANISGLIAGTILWWQFILGSRFINKKFTSDYLGLVSLHTTLGITGGLLAFLHPILEMNVYGTSIEFLYTWSLTTERALHITFGRIGFVLLVVIWVSSALLRKTLKRRPWLYIHYLTYPMMFFIFLHAQTIGSFILEFPLIRGYWMFLALSYSFILIYRLTKFLNLAQPRYLLKNKQQVTDGIVLYTFEPVSSQTLSPKVGQFAYIKPSFFGESHPFTIMSYDKKSGELTFGIKSIGPFTKKLEQVKLGTTIYLDGPYGVFTQPGHNDQPKIIFAGGIGVTPFVELVQQYGNEHTYMFYSNKKLDHALCRPMFKKKLGTNYVDAITRESVDKTCIPGRLTIERIKEHLPDAILKKAHVFICGSPEFTTGIKACLADLGIPNKRIYTEAFGF